MNKSTYCQRSVTINLRPELDEYLRRKAEQENKSMNRIVNDAIESYMKGCEEHSSSSLCFGGNQ